MLGGNDKSDDEKTPDEIGGEYQKVVSHGGFRSNGELAI